jgi:subtilisin family serine protease
LVGSLILPASAAVADPATDGFWYYDVFHIQDAHDAGWTGAGVTIGVIDGQINLDVPTLQGADIEVQPSVCWDDAGAVIPPTSTDLTAEHGTNVVSFLVGSGAGYSGQTGVKGIVPDAKIIFTSDGLETEDGSFCKDELGEFESPVAHGIWSAIDAGADIISISLGGDPDTKVADAIAEAVHKGIVVISSLPNQVSDGPWPGEANGVVSVQSADSNGEVSGDAASHENEQTDVVGPGVKVVWQGDTTWEQQKYARGTSIATPIVAGFLALVAQKYPDATGNQLIQTLVRNTGVEDHALEDDILYGYGMASATHMLRIDPMVYDDVNLLIGDGDFDLPTRADIENWSGRLGETAEPEDGSPTTPEPAFVPYAFNPMVAIALGGVGLLVVGVIILVIVLATRRARRTPRA